MSKLHKKYNDETLNNYKLYRNALNRTKQAKKNYYSEAFVENKNNSGKLWNVINELTNMTNKKKHFPTELETKNGITHDLQVITEELNNYFVTVGKILADTIESSSSIETSSEQNEPPSLANSFYFTPATTGEITAIIRNLNPKKSIRENDIDTKFLKFSNEIISPYICDLFNSCIEQGKFPDALKIAEVVPILKKTTQNKRPTTDQSHYYPNLVK